MEVYLLVVKFMNKIFKIFGIIIVACVVILVIYYILSYDPNAGEYNNYLKNYKVNEYIPVYVNDEEMAKKYFSKYRNIINSDASEAFNLVDEEYRKNKFNNNIENFKSYIRSLNINNVNVDRYYKTTESEYEVFGVYDTNGNLYKFKTKGVMQFVVEFN